MTTDFLLNLEWPFIQPLDYLTNAYTIFLNDQNQNINEGSLISLWFKSKNTTLDLWHC